MVDEKDDQYDDHEEGEYHFSDDQVNYDMEPEARAAAEAPTARGRSSSTALIEFIQKRKGIIVGVVFVLLLGIVLKILVPTNTAPNTQITSVTTPATQPVVAKSQPETTPPPVQEQPVGTVTVTANTTPVQTPVLAPLEVTPPVAQQPSQQANTAQPSLTSQTQPPQQMAQPITATPVVTQQAITPVVPSDNKNMQDRLSTLEQQNAAIMNLLQTEYAQKIADYETQQTAARGKMEELTKRLNRIEKSLNEMTNLLQSKNGGGMAESQVVAVPAMTHPETPRNSYTVQAIIPGRAWLKSDSGETVTVAEGDLLRDYGRITKIDPYDGIVNIDNGSKIITLSYGTNVG